MTLNNLLQLIANINPNYSFYMKANGKNLPLAKIALTSNTCLLYPGENTINKRRLLALIGHLHHGNIAVKMVIENKKYPVYGLQLSTAKSSATLM